MPDPFPNELVEAVEEACTIIENRCGTVRGIGPAMREALAAVLPLIEQRVKDQLREGSVEKSDPTDAEKMRAAYDAGAADAEQRVIDRLAREADDDAVHISSLADPRIALCGGQKKRSMADFASPSPDKWEGCWTCLAEKRAIDERVACGVAAERARWGAKQRQPEAVCDRCGAWKGLRAVGESCNTNCGGRVVAAALAPERTTALRNLEAAMDAEARVREERPIVRFLPGAPLSDDTEFAFIGEETIPFVNARKHEQTVDLARTRTVREIVEALRNAGRTVATGHEAARMIERTFLSPDNPEGSA